MRALLVLVLVIVLASAGGCGGYEGAPVASLDGVSQGLLADPGAPLVIRFSKPVVPSSVSVKVARYVTDIEGNLGDEDDDPSTNLDVVLSSEDGDDVGCTSSLDAARMTLTITPTVPLPIGPRLVVLVEPGLDGDDDHPSHARRRIPFGFAFHLDCNAPVKSLASGDFFFLANVLVPLPAQVQLLADVRIDPATGRLIGQFTNADRNADPTRCSPACKANEACRTVPAQACVIPSEKATSVDEWPDWIPNAAPPVGFTFTADGCARDQADGTGLLVTAPVDVEVTVPHVTLRNARLVVSFDGTHATGTLSADGVLLGTVASGAASGDLTAIALPAGAAPPGIPPPPKESP